MIKVIVGNNLERRTVLVNEDDTIRKILEENDVDYSVGMTTLDGTSLRAGEMDKTLADFGIKESCRIVNVVKADNA